MYYTSPINYQASNFSLLKIWEDEIKILKQKLEEKTILYNNLRDKYEQNLYIF